MAIAGGGDEFAEHGGEKFVEIVQRGEKGR